LRMKLGCLRAKSNAIMRLKWCCCDETVIPTNLRSKIHGVCECNSWHFGANRFDIRRQTKSSRIRTTGLLLDSSTT
jgi:hypothetical protein